jgi:hypothetical protein
MNRQVIVFQKLVRRMPDIYGKYAGHIWEVCRTYMGNMPDIYGKYAGHIWEVCRTYMGNSHCEMSYPQIFAK